MTLKCYLDEIGGRRHPAAWIEEIRNVTSLQLEKKGSVSQNMQEDVWFFWVEEYLALGSDDLFLPGTSFFIQSTSERDK